jgi:hypothetical protein
VSQRRALLIGVPDCDDSSFSPIAQVVRSDVRKLRTVLSHSAYDVTCVGTDQDGQDPSRNRIRSAIRKACAEAPKGGVLLLYFSGHGVTIDGVDYLVPSDAYREDGALHPDQETLVPAIPDVTRCQARLVVFFLDACRDAPAEESREARSQGGVLHFPGDGSLVMVAGCAPGQRCHYGQEGSFFTQALTDVLDRRNPARTLAKVLAEVEHRMRRAAGAGEGQQQVPNAYPQAMLAAAGPIEICDGDELSAAWRRVAESNPLWELSPDAGEAVRENTRQVVETCARRHTAAAKVFHARTGIHDPWFDQDYPSRVLDIAATLLSPHVRLNGAEAALLVATPFLREEILAHGLRIAADHRPGDFLRSYETGPRTDLELTHEMYPHVIRRAEGLGHRNQPEARDALVMWLVHRWLAVFPSLWQADGGAAGDQGCELLARQHTRLGFWGALREVFPQAREQRCWFHKIANVLGALPKSAHPGAKKHLAEIWNAQDKTHALRAVKEFEAAYGVKHPKAVAKVVDDLDELLAFYDFPAEHWQHLRTTNPIESTFATVRHRTKVTKGPGSRAAGLAMAFKLIESAQARWRAVNAPHLVALVRAGATFEGGKLIERPAETAAA